MTCDPHNLLAHCHPDLARIANATPQTPAWQIDYGLRTLQAEAAAVATGHSQTMHSRHLPDAHYGNVAMAFDFFVVGPGGKPDWNVEPNGAHYATVGSLLLQTAAKLGIKAQWGGQVVGAWTDGQVSHWRDWGHLQLDPSEYP